MESMILLSLVAALVVSPVSLECVDGNCTEPRVHLFSINLGSIFPFFGPVDFDGERDQPMKTNNGMPLNDAIDPFEPPLNESDASDGIVSFRIMQVFSIRNPIQEVDSKDQMFGDEKLPLMQTIFDNILAETGLLDLSGKNMTSSEVYSALRARKENGRPVTTLILSNSRIHPMDAGTFAAAESSINTLVMDNTSVNLDALRGLTNLKVLNLSNNALTTFPWYGLMSNTLEVLDLSNNKFEEIRPELSMLRSLRELYLSNNKIMFVETTPLDMLPNLETLDLSMNMLTKGNFASLYNLKRLNLDWNFFILMNSDCQLPAQSLSLKLASNPWRCDCGLLQARDFNEILDLDQLQCGNHDVYYYCNDCPREFLPSSNSPDKQSVAEMTKDSIEHLDCFDLPELFKSINRLKEEPEKFVMDVCLFIGLIIMLIGSIFLVVRKCCCKKNTNRKFWLKVQQIPHLDKIGKPQEIPYIKIDEPMVQA